MIVRYIGTQYPELVDETATALLRHIVQAGYIAVQFDNVEKLSNTQAPDGRAWCYGAHVLPMDDFEPVL